MYANIRPRGGMRYLSTVLDFGTGHCNFKGRWNPALNELEDLKLLLDSDLPSSFQGKVETAEYLTDAQPELFQVETQSSKHEQLKGYVEFISAGLFCFPIS